MTVNIKNFYLNSPLKRYEYLRLKINDIIEDVQQQNELQTKVTSGVWVCAEIWKGMYGLLHARLLSQELLEKRLTKNRYMQSKLTPGCRNTT